MSRTLTRRIAVAALPLTLASVLVSPVAQAQSLSNTAVIERPVVRTVRIGTTVSAPASALLPPALVPMVDATAGFREAGAACERDIRRLRARYLGARRHEPTRRAGLESLSMYTAPEAAPILLEVLITEAEDVQNWLLEHLATRTNGEIGQAALAHIAIYAEDESLRDRALAQLAGPANSHTRFIIDLAARSDHPDALERMAPVARALGLTEAIGDLILADAGVSMTARRRGNLAIARVGDEIVYISDYTRDPDVRFGLPEALGPLPELHDVADESSSSSPIDDLSPVPPTPNPIHDSLVALAEQFSGKPVDFGRRFEEWREWHRDHVFHVDHADER